MKNDNVLVRDLPTIPADWVQVHSGIYGKVFETKNYSQFHFIEGNRELYTGTAQMNDLLADMKSKGQLMPILVTLRDGKYFVLDGQNRLFACESLDISVQFYLLPFTLALLVITQSLNTKRANWSWKQFLHMYVTLHIDSYILYEKLLDKYPIGHSAMLAVLFNRRNVEGGGSDTKVFRDGELKIPTYSLARIEERADELLMCWSRIFRAFANRKGGNKHKTPNSKFVNAYLSVRKLRQTDGDPFDLKYMLRKLDSNDVSNFRGALGFPQFEDELIRIYNHGAREDRRLLK